MESKTCIVGALIVLGLVIAPGAHALSWGVDSTGIADVKASGATPQLGQTWVGTWMKTSGWSGYENALRSMKSQGITPVVMWYYWGDKISVDIVTNGGSGMTKGEWDSMAGEMASRGNAIMGGSPWYVVLEPEFNKNGISSWETFDGYLQNQANIIKGKASGAKIVVGFGSWGGWDIYDRAVGASHMTGFQILRGSTRDSVAISEGAADQMISTATTLKARFGKPVLVFDYGIATYGGWEGVQERSLRNVMAKLPQIEAAGVSGIVWRYTRDNTLSSGYFGPAESTWGAKYSGGGNKLGWDELVALIKGGSGAYVPPSTSPAPAPTPTTSPTTGGLTNVKGNEWWIEAAAPATPTKVEARVNGGAWINMPKMSWGAYAVSTHAPTGSTVEIRATYASSTISGKYAWPSATPTSGGVSTSGFSATFSSVSGNEWWVQANVKGTQTLASVSVSINGGAFVPLAKQSWGADAYAKSVHILKGQSVKFRATSTTGATSDSTTYVVW